MGRWTVLAVIILLSAGCSKPAPEAWQRGNEAYIAGDYTAAIEAYNTIVDDGLASHELYYNLANAYFKDGRTGKAILFYNRALLLRPGDRDTRYNLEIAESRVRVRIEPVPQFFVVRWVGALRRTMSGNGWAVMSLVVLALALAAALLYLLSGRRLLRKTGFYAAIAGAGLFVVSLGFSLAERRAMLHSGDAIVMSSSATVKSSPDTAGKDAFILYEGAKVRILSALGTWREIEIADGNKGWIAASAIETIR